MNVPDCDQNLVNFNFSNGYSQWGGRANNGSENFIKMFADDLTMVKGKHTWKFGGQLSMQYYNGFGRQCVAGCITFDFKNTGRPGDTNFATAGGSPVASMLLGYANGGSIDTIRYIGQQWPSFAGFIQDDWRVRPNLMLNLGLRWETTLPPTGENDNWSDFDPDPPESGRGRFARRPDLRRRLQGLRRLARLADGYYKAFGPRFGLAYTWKEKTVIRLSYGLSYGNITTVTGSTHNLGFTLTDTQSDSTQGLQPRFLVKDGQPFWHAPPFVDPSFGNGRAMPWWQGREATRPPAYQSINFSIQRQLSSSMVAEIAYNGSLGSRLQAGLLSYNALESQIAGSIRRDAAELIDHVAGGGRRRFHASVPRLRRNSGEAAPPSVRPCGPIRSSRTSTLASGGGDHSGHSTYHSGMVRFEKRYSQGLQFQTSYVFSKLLTDSDSYWSDRTVRDGSLQPRAGEVHRRVRRHAQFQVQRRLGPARRKGQSGLNLSGPLDWIAGGWRISGIATYSGGQPAAITTSNGLPLFGGGNRPIISTYDGWKPATKGDSFDPAVDRTIQPASFFPAQPANMFGNMTRYNPKYPLYPIYNENLSVAKSFRIKEQSRIDFRAEVFNVFNRVRFGLGSLGLADRRPSESLARRRATRQTRLAKCNWL